MAGQAEDQESSFALAEIALGQIRALRQPARPHNYEVWYHYATGHHPTINKTINELIAHGGVTQADMERIYDEHFSPLRHPERIDQTSSKFLEHVGVVLAMIQETAGVASRHSQNLADANHKIGLANDRDAIRAVVQDLLQTTREMRDSNLALEERLQTSKQEIAQLQMHLEAVRTESLTDQLTTLANRKCFDSTFASAIDKASGADEPLSLMIADIDHFKAFNDTYGHLIGDQVLRLVAIALKDNLKGQDLAARYGGEEFAVLLPRTSLRQATTVAEHIRRAVMGKELMKRSTGENLGRITVSIGVASLRRGESGAGLIERADNCLYVAKRHGRNRVICEVDPEVTPVAHSQVA
jgi:diguanylate cyclase